MKPQCNTSADCLRELARVMDQFGITSALEASNSHYVRYFGKHMRREKLEIPFFTNPEEWQFAIAEVEGKPVFIGDKLYWYDGRETVATEAWGEHSQYEKMTWNPPKPSTVMVELPVKSAKTFADCYEIMNFNGAQGDLARACKTALEKLK